MSGVVLPAVAVEILRAGGSLIVSQVVMPEHMENMARAAKAGGGHITFRVTVLVPEIALRVASAGPGAVTFDLTGPPPNS